MEQSLSRRLEAMDRRLNGLLRKAGGAGGHPCGHGAGAGAFALLLAVCTGLCVFAHVGALRPRDGEGPYSSGKKGRCRAGGAAAVWRCGALATVLVTRLTRELVRALPQAAAWVGEAAVPLAARPVRSGARGTAGSAARRDGQRAHFPGPKRCRLGGVAVGRADQRSVQHGGLHSACAAQHGAAGDGHLLHDCRSGADRGFFSPDISRRTDETRKAGERRGCGRQCSCRCAAS